MSLKILFISRGKRPDYLNDCLYHGLKSLDGVDVYSSSDLWYMYDDLGEDVRSRLYGRGFTVYGKIPLSRRSRNFNGLQKLVLAKLIAERYFDIVIYGSIWRCDRFLNLVSRYYKKDQIILLDGEDHTRISPHFSRGMYFKRENLDTGSDAPYPISFAVPESLVVGTIQEKSQFLASVIPGNLNTYIFDEEESYFHDYRVSKFALTTRKGGWDCLRHYEILMNGCIPLFPFLGDCPKRTMTNYPKERIIHCSELLNAGKFTESLYNEMALSLLDYTKSKLTTKHLAQYVLSFI